MRIPFLQLYPDGASCLSLVEKRPNAIGGRSPSSLQLTAAFLSSFTSAAELRRRATLLAQAEGDRGTKTDRKARRIDPSTPTLSEGVVVDGGSLLSFSLFLFFSLLPITHSFPLSPLSPLPHKHSHREMTPTPS